MGHPCPVRVSEPVHSKELSECGVGAYSLIAIEMSGYIDTLVRLVAGDIFRERSRLFPV